MKAAPRILLCGKDIMFLTGKGKRSAQRIMTAIKIKNNKTRSDFITLDEFCDHFHLKKEAIEALLQ